MNIDTCDAVLKLDSNLHYNEKEDLYYNFEYCVERERGQLFEEDLLNPGYFELELQENVSNLYVAASVQPSVKIDCRYIKQALAQENERKKKSR